MNTKELLEKKEAMCLEIVQMGLKKVTSVDVDDAGSRHDLKPAQARRVWKNFTQTGGKLDKRFKKGSTVPTIKMKQSHSGYYYSREVKAPEAAKIILDYMHSNLTSREISVKYKVSVKQFYEWISELNVSGTILGVKVLNPQKYAKLSVLDAIWLKRKPKTTRKSIARLSNSERVALVRVGQILEKYLTALAGE